MATRGQERGPGPRVNPAAGGADRRGAGTELAARRRRGSPRSPRRTGKSRSWVRTHASRPATGPGTRVLLARRLDTGVLRVVAWELVALSREGDLFIPHMDILSWEESCPVSSLLPFCFYLGTYLLTLPFHPPPRPHYIFAYTECRVSEIS